MGNILKEIFYKIKLGRNQQETPEVKLLLEADRNSRKFGVSKEEKRLINSRKQREKKFRNLMNKLKEFRKEYFREFETELRRVDINNISEEADIVFKSFEELAVRAKEVEEGIKKFEDNPGDYQGLHEEIKWLSKELAETSKKIHLGEFVTTPKDVSTKKATGEYDELIPELQELQEDYIKYIKAIEEHTLKLGINTTSEEIVETFRLLKEKIALSGGSRLPLETQSMLAQKKQELDDVDKNDGKEIPEKHEIEI